MARELNMNGKVKLKTIMKEFNDRFPYLRLSLYASSERDKDSKIPLDFEKTISEVREKKSSEPAIIRGGQKVKNLEKMMDKLFGLYCQVAYSDSKGNYYTTGKLDEMSLRELNTYGESEGWIKDKWHI
jgi:hypothetical protein